MAAGKVLAALFVVLLFVCLLAAALLAGWRGGGAAAEGGAAPRRGADPAKSPHLVVDTLNLAHWLLEPKAMSPDVIVATIDQTAPALKRRHSGRLIYVLKDRESQFNDDAARELYKAAAVRNGVTVAVAERYPDPPAGAKPSEAHSSRGRDDFYTSLLARRYRCAVLTGDQLRDFDEFRSTIPPFYVQEYAFWRKLPQRDFVRPDSPAYRGMRRPKLVRPAEYPELEALRAAR